MSLSKKDKQGIALIILSVIVMLAFAITPLVLKKRTLNYDPDSFCINNQNYPHTVLLVDKTDPLSEAQIDYLKQLIKHLKQTLQQYEKLSIYILDHENYVAATPVFAMCSPGTGREANELYQNPGKIQRQFDEFFGQPLEQTLQSLTQTTTAPISPILEMLNEVALIPDFNSQHPRKLIIMSDLLHNMPNYSHYRQTPDFQEWLTATPSPKLWTNTRVQIIYLRRDKNQIQGATHLDFWRQYFRYNGAQLDPISQIR